MTDKNSFVKGAFVLALANVTVKIIGAVFKIPLARLLGNSGMGIFSTAYSVYTWVFVLATAGLPVAVSKTVSESYARGRVAETSRILYVSIMLMLIIGLAGSFLLWRFAVPIGNIMGNPDAVYGFKAVAPSIVFLSLTAALRGYFQGRQNMLPTAISEVAEAVGKLCAGIWFAGMFSKYGIGYAAAGAMLGVCIGEICGFAVVVIIYLCKRGKEYRVATRECDGRMQILKRIISLALPVTLGSSVLSLANMADTATIMKRLARAGLTYNEALDAWGAYSGFAVSLFNMPVSLLGVMGICAVPAVAGAYTEGKSRIEQTVLSAIRLTLIFALPCGVGLSLLSKPVLMLVYKNATATAPLSLLGFAVIPVAVSMVAGSILQATGNAVVPVRNMLLGAAVKLLINYILVAQPEINIMGAPIATLTSYMLIMILNLLSVKRILKISFSASDFVVRPLVAVTVMALAVTYLYKALPQNSLSTLMIIGAGAIVYIAMLFATGLVKEEDIQMLPRGRGLAYRLKKTGMIRK